jgi:acyl-CoA hydrolase
MVAIDNQMRPIPIPQLIPESDEEKVDWEDAQSIRTDLLERKKQQNHSDSD